MPGDSRRLESLVASLLGELAEQRGRGALRGTPHRVASTLRFLTRGYGVDPAGILDGALVDASSDEMVLLRNVRFFSLCEHHLLPFSGRVHVAYLPSGKVAGLSKLARLVDVFARRLQVQERLTTQIADALESGLAPKGVGVVVEAAHMCMVMRGVSKSKSVTVTSAARGAFRSDPKTRAEFLKLIHRSDTD